MNSANISNFVSSESSYEFRSLVQVHFHQVHNRAQVCPEIFIARVHGALVAISLTDGTLVAAAAISAKIPSNERRRQKCTRESRAERRREVDRWKESVGEWIKRGD